MNIAVNISEMQRHQEHKARQERLWSGKPTIPPDLAIQELRLLHEKAILKILAEGKATTAKAENRFALQMVEAVKRIETLELDLADAQARILGQAAQICSMNDIEMMACATPKRPIATIVAGVLKDFPGVTWEDVICVRRQRDLIRPRHLCWYAVYEERQDLSFPMMARVFKRDHSSLLYAVHKIRAEKMTTP